MHIRWTSNAAADPTRIVERIRTGNPEAAQHVAQTIYNRVARLWAHSPIVDVPGSPIIPERSCLLRGPISLCMKS